MTILCDILVMRCQRLEDYKSFSDLNASFTTPLMEIKHEGGSIMDEELKKEEHKTQESSAQNQD